MRTFARVQRRRPAPVPQRAAAPVRAAVRVDQGIRALLAPSVFERGATRPAVAEPIRTAPPPEPAAKALAAPAEKKIEAAAPKPQAGTPPPTVMETKGAAGEEKRAGTAATKKEESRPPPAAEQPAFPTGPALESAGGQPNVPIAVNDAVAMPEAASAVPAAKDEAKAAESKAAPPQAAGAKAREAVEQRRGLEKLKQQVRGEAKKLRRHPRPEKKRAEATAASALPEPAQNEQSSKEKSTRELRKLAADQLAQQDAVARQNAELFKAAFRKRVDEQKAPQSEEAVKEYADKPPVEGSTAALESDVASKQSRIAEPLQQRLGTLPAPDQPKKASDIPRAPVPPPPAPLEAKGAVPERKEGIEGMIQRHRDRMDDAMKKNRLTDKQLAESREPQFLEALEAKRQAERKIAETPGTYRAREQEVREGAEGNAAETLDSALQGMGAVNAKAQVGVHGGQRGTETKTEKRQGEIKGFIDGVYNRTVGEVDRILKGMAKDATDKFTAALTLHGEAFKKRVRVRIENYYGRFRIDDKLFGPAPIVVDERGNTRPLTRDEIFGRKKPEGKLINPDVWNIFKQEKDVFLAGMDGALDTIALSVEQQLSAAAAEIQKGENEIDDFKRTLSGEELEFAEQLQEQVRLKFANLRESVDAAREDLLQALADQYNETVNQLEVTFREIDDELKKSWLDRAVEFIETVGRTVFQLAELIVSILTRLAGLVWDIIAHPIRFFETLVGGLGVGIRRFIDGFTVYLQEAFWTWLTDASPGRNIRLSVSSGVESLFDLVLQVLDLGPAGIRAIVEKVFGKEFMARIDKVLALGEKAVEPLRILLDKGPLALWEHLREQLGTLIASTFERIKESVFFAFVEKALKWIAGFFVPGGGFVKVVKAIVKAFQFVADNLQRLKHFFDSVFDSMEAAVQGRTDVVAGKIIEGLKMGIVLALDFLAKQLGLDKIVDSVQKIIHSLRRPIVNALEWLLRKVKPFVLKVVGAVVKAGEKVVAAGKKAVARVRNWWRARKGFTSEAGEPHSLYFEGGESNPRLMIRSEAQTYGDFITAVKVPSEKAGVKAQAVGIAKDLDAEVAKARRPGQESLDEDPSGEITRLLEKLAAATAKFIPDTKPQHSSPAVFGPLVHGFGSSARVAVLGPKHAAGSPPGVGGGHWETLRRRMQGGSTLYVRGHLLNENLGGPGTWPNLTPITQDFNNRASDSMLRVFEGPVKDKVAEGVRVDFSVTAKYGRVHPLESRIPMLEASANPRDHTIADIVRAEKYVPVALETRANEVGGKAVVKPQELKHEIPASSVEDYQLSAEPMKPYYLDEAVAHGEPKELARLEGMNAKIMDELFARRPPGGFRTRAQIEACGLDWDKACGTRGLLVRIYRVK